jgi:hypothetical protein
VRDLLGGETSPASWFQESARSPLLEGVATPVGVRAVDIVRGVAAEHEFVNSKVIRRMFVVWSFRPMGSNSSASFDGTMRLWDLNEGKELKKFDGPGNFVEAVCFTPDGKRALCCYGPRGLCHDPEDRDCGGAVLRSDDRHCGALIAFLVENCPGN